MGVVVLGHHFNGVLLGRLPLIKKTEMARSAGLQKRVGHAFARKTTSTAGTEADLLFPVGMTSGVGPLCGDGIRRGEHLQALPRGLHLEAHTGPKTRQEI